MWWAVGNDKFLRSGGGGEVVYGKYEVRGVSNESDIMYTRAGRVVSL